MNEINKQNKQTKQTLISAYLETTAYSTVVFDDREYSYATE